MEAKINKLEEFFVAADASKGRKWTEAQRLKQQETRAKIRDAVIAGYGGKCQCCGESCKEFLSLDHKNSDGGTDRVVNGGSYGIYRKLIAEGFPKDNYQLLCMNCNWALGRFGKCPHQPAVTRPVASSVHARLLIIPELGGWIRPKHMARICGRSQRTVLKWCLDGTLIAFGYKVLRDIKGFWWISSPEVVARELEAAKHVGTLPPAMSIAASKPADLASVAPSA